MTETQLMLVLAWELSGAVALIVALWQGQTHAHPVVGFAGRALLGPIGLILTLTVWSSPPLGRFRIVDEGHDDE